MSTDNQKPWVAISIAVIGLISALGVALISNGDRLIQIFLPDNIETPDIDPAGGDPTPSPAPVESSDSQSAPTEVSTQEIDRLRIDRATVEGENVYSSSYGPEKIIDNNIDNGNYWSTRSGSIIEVILSFSLEEISTVSELHFVSARSGSSYTQPQTIELAFFNEAGDEIGQREITLVPPFEGWERNKFEPIADVASIRMELLDPLNDTARFMSLNEVQFHGYSSN